MDKAKIKSLHSRYNPQGEADRYIASLSLNESIRFFILIEPGLGYMVAPLRKSVPGARIISLHAEKHTFEPEACETANKKPKIEKPDSEWHPETGISVQDFLETVIPDLPASEIRLLEWRPAMSVYGENYRALIAETVEFIKRADANLRTLKTFGRLWFRNFFKNLDIIKTVLYPTPLSAPLLVTGAGPALEEVIPLVRLDCEKGKLCTLAASSSVAALEAGNLKPDMVISTDGSAWAKLHLYEMFRTSVPCPLVAALTAALPSQCETTPVLLLSDGNLWQTLVLKELKIPFIALPQRGTVAASALDLAFALTKGEIFIAGMDLENNDIPSHARPYSLDRIMEEKSARTNPVYSQAYKRASLIKEGGSYGIYASWFKKQLASYPKRLHPLGKNSPVFGPPETAGNMPWLANTGEKSSIKKINFTSHTLKPGKTYSKDALAVLEKAIKEPTHKKALQRELVPLLLPGKKEVSLDELAAAIRSAAGIRTARKHG